MQRLNHPLFLLNFTSEKPKPLYKSLLIYLVYGEMMPYIEQDRRKPYQPVIKRITQDLANINDNVSYDATIRDLAEAEQEVERLLVDVDMELQDGDLNYIMTKILKNLKIDDIAHFQENRLFETFKISFVNIVRFIYTPRYFNYNRALGLFTSCGKEWERRNPNNCVLVTRMFNQMIDVFYKYNQGPYEDNKRELNGDV